MAVQTAMIFVRQGKAYLPVMALTEHGVLIGIEPVHTADLTLEALLIALEKVSSAGHPRIPHPTREEWRYLSRRDPILRAAGVKSWRAFSQYSVVYTIGWTEQAVVIYISHLDHLGRTDYASAKKLTFPRDAPFRTIVEAILKDIRSRPELQTDNSKAQSSPHISQY
jgi:hypothetical protein